MNNIQNEKSVFDTRTLDDIYKEIQDVYNSDGRPWIIGYSGGKDSTTALQLVWYAIEQLDVEKRNKPIYVISTDTLVETPVIVDYIVTTLKKIDETARKKKMPITTHKLRPIVNDTFWVNLIGRGYPAPQRTFRWCTDRMKIKPADRFITEKASEYGEVILILGIRKQESMTRAQVMSLYQIKGSPLQRHSTLPGSYVYAPIQDWSVNDVWTYLLQAPSPWGNNNRDLVALYRSAQGECPLVVDDTTPSCGNSRFGCWTCTVVDRDRTMEALIDSGQEWMEPLLEFRDFLSSTQDPEKKHIYRELKRRMGYVSFKSDGSGKITRGPYKLDFCKEILRRLLTTQMQVRKHGPIKDMTLIDQEELHAIRRIWRMERGDWVDSLPKIYMEVTGQDLPWAQNDLVDFGEREEELLNKICKENGIPTRLVTKLLDMELQTQGMNRRASIYSKLDKVLSEEWRTEEEILDELAKRKQNVGRD